MVLARFLDGSLHGAALLCKQMLVGRGWQVVEVYTR